MTDDYLSKYLEQSELEEAIDVKTSQKPNWVDPSNNSEKAYDAIKKLKSDKIAYIKKHGKKSDYTTKSRYLIGKAEVARLVGPNVKPQPLFHSRSSSYCEELLKYFNDTNDDLEKAKNKRLAKSNRGLMQKTKEELVQQLRLEKETKNEELTSLVDEVYQRVLDKMPIDVKRRLGLF